MTFAGTISTCYSKFNLCYLGGRLMKRFTIILVSTLLFISCCSYSSITYAAKPIFKDVPTSHYAYGAVKWAYEFDIVNGFTDGTFRPNQPITEQQFAQLLVSYFDLEITTDTLEKYTPNKIQSDTNYNTLAAFQVPLNGYFQNDIRNNPVKRGVVAQSLTYLLDGKANLQQSIQFLLDHNISSGQYPQYEQTNLAKFFGSSNNLTRAQIVALFYNLQSKSFFYISEDAENSFNNKHTQPLYKQANLARISVDNSLRLGRNWTPGQVIEKINWNGVYSSFHQYGPNDIDSKGRYLTITNSTKDKFYVEYDTFNGYASGSIQGYATIVSSDKARMTKTIDGNSCVIEFQKQANHFIKTSELNCANMRDRSTDFNGVLQP